MATSEQITLFVGALDPAIKERLAADAAERQASINDVAVTILASEFKVKFVGTGRKGPGARGSTVGSFRMPLSLAVKIGAQATRTRLPKRTIVERVLAEHYGIEPPPAKRRTAVAAA